MDGDRRPVVMSAETIGAAVLSALSIHKYVQS